MFTGASGAGGQRLLRHRGVLRGPLRTGGCLQGVPRLAVRRVHRSEAQRLGRRQRPDHAGDSIRSLRGLRAGTGHGGPDGGERGEDRVSRVQGCDQAVRRRSGPGRAEPRTRRQENGVYDSRGNLPDDPERPHGRRRCVHFNS